MKLADALYDSAMQEVEYIEPLMSPKQKAELDQRLERMHSGAATLTPWTEVYQRLVKRHP